MIENTLLHFKTKVAFNTELEAGNIKDDSIVFIDESKEIWTHGVFYDGSQINLESFVTKDELTEELNSKINYSEYLRMLPVNAVVKDYSNALPADVSGFAAYNKYYYAYAVDNEFIGEMKSLTLSALSKNYYAPATSVYKFPYLSNGTVVYKLSDTGAFSEYSTLTNIQDIIEYNGSVYMARSTGKHYKDSTLQSFTLVGRYACTETDLYIIGKGKTIQISNDGTVTTHTNDLTSISVEQAFYVNNIFIAFGKSTSTTNSWGVYTSTDGITWKSGRYTGTYCPNAKMVHLQDDLFIIAPLSANKNIYFCNITESKCEFTSYSLTNITSHTNSNYIDAHDGQLLMSFYTPDNSAGFAIFTVTKSGAKIKRLEQNTTLTTPNISIFLKSETKPNYLLNINNATDTGFTVYGIDYTKATIKAKVINEYEFVKYKKD